MTVRPDPNELMHAARRATRRAMLDLAKTTGIATSDRPVVRGGPATISDVSTLDGVDLSRRVELAARNQARNYVRAAREAGFTWHDIGMALRLVPADAQADGDAVADAAFSYTAGPSDTEHARWDGRSVVWHCGSCDRSVTDHGVCNGPANDELGHAENCSRLAATIAAQTARWASFDADWEAGQ